MKKKKSQKSLSLKKLTISKLTNPETIIGGEDSEVNCLSNPPEDCPQSCLATNCLSCGTHNQNPSGFC